MLELATFALAGQIITASARAADLSTIRPSLHVQLPSDLVVLRAGRQALLFLPHQILTPLGRLRVASTKL